MSKMQSLWDKLPKVVYQSINKVPEHCVAGIGNFGKFIFIPCKVTGLIPSEISRNVTQMTRSTTSSAIAIVEQDGVWTLLGVMRERTQASLLLDGGQPYEVNADIIEGIVAGKIQKIDIGDLLSLSFKTENWSCVPKLTLGKSQNGSSTSPNLR